MSKQIKPQTSNKAFMEELTWEQARPYVIKVNPELASVIDQVSPSKKYTLFRACYPYGCEILKRGNLYLPTATGELMPLMSGAFDSRLKERLGYNLETNPVSLVLHNALELFFTLEDRTLPFYGLIPNGKIFGLWKVLNPRGSHQSKFIWDMTSGARSVFMLPKISEAESHNRLKKAFRVNADAPKTLLDHWYVFREITRHPDFSEPWHTEMLFFPHEWFTNLEDKAWMGFNYFLYKNVWIGSEFWRNQFILDLMFSVIQKDRGVKPNPYIVDTIKYLIAIGVGALPGFSPAVDSSVAPIKGLQNAYLNIYGLKEYFPVVMQPGLFDMYSKSARHVYYSLQFPTAIEFGPKARRRTSIITDIHGVKSFHEKTVREISSGRFNLEHTPFQDLIERTSFDYFHNNVASYSGMRESREIPDEDNTFSQVLCPCQNKGFPETATFVRGCVRVGLK